MAERAGLIFVRRDVLVIIHQLAQGFDHLGSRVLKCWRLTCQNRRLQTVPPFESSLLEYAKFTPHPFYFRIQIGGEVPGGYGL